MSIRRRATSISLALVASGLLLTGCGKKESTIVVEDFSATPSGQEGDAKDGAEAAPKAEKPTANLPAPPPASAYVVPETNSDGTHRVRGITHHKEKYLDQDVQVLGELTFVSPPCDPKEAQKEGRTCIKSHLFIKDLDGTKTLQVVGVNADFIKRAKLEEGQQHVFHGKYVQSGAGFINSGDGLLLLTAADDVPVRVERKK